MVELYYYPGNASLAVHILLEELGDPFGQDALALRRQLAKYQSTAARRV